MHKKNTYKVIVSIVVALAFIMPGVAVFANVEETEIGNQAVVGIPTTEKTSAITREIDNSACYTCVEMSELVSVEKSSRMATLDSTMISDTEYDDFHPTVAGDSSGRFFAGFELTMDGTDYYPDFWYSLDGGSTWTESGYFSESLGSEYPDADSNDNGFYFTFGPPDANGGQEWIGVAEDLDEITARVLDWSARGFGDFEYMSISCYTRPWEPWNFGGLAASGYNGHYPGREWDGNPFIFYPISKTLSAIGWITCFEHYYHTDIAIDEITELSYAVYDNTVEAFLFVRIDDFGVWDGNYHPHVTSWHVGDGITNLMNPSIEANDDTVVLVAEAEGNIVCFYSDNGFASVQQSVVVDSAAYPEVKMSFDRAIFVCSYIKDGAVYAKISEDGGATWKNEQQVEDSEVESEYGAHDLGKAMTGVYAVWEDNRSTDIDIYFGQALETTAPYLDIISIKGGVGVTATIKNVGDVAVTNVTWTLTVKGGLLGFIKVEKNGTEAILAVDGEIKVKSGLFLGFGKIVATVSATCNGGSSDLETTKGRQIIIFTIIS